MPDIHYFCRLMKPVAFQSKVVNIGNLPLGGNYPVRIQSMTSTNTLDTRSTVEQAIRMVEAGCEYVRITAQGVKEAENLAVIKNELKKSGYTTPLIADIHYNPKAAEVAARIVEKVRINPGNYVDRKKGRISYSESEYFADLDKIRDRIKPLILICKQYGTVLRIGSNHGSLSERILLRYGDTPAGMVASALEFVRICEDLGFREIVLSMKASNVKVMVQANRLLVQKMIEGGKNYPIHLGVTEAGDAEDGRMKSAAGIGVLLEEGIGDTIRVSLTEDPEFEIPVAKSIVIRFNNESKRKKIPVSEAGFGPSSFKRRESTAVGKIGGEQAPVVICDEGLTGETLEYSSESSFPEYLYNVTTGTLVPYSESNSGNRSYDKDNKLRFVNSFESLIGLPGIGGDDEVLVLSTNHNNPIHECRRMMNHLIENRIMSPVILQRNYGDSERDEVLIKASADFAFLLVDGLIDGIWIQHKNLGLNTISTLSFGILQATGSRITKTEYIACPSCGRTLFGIQETLKKIKSRTSHLKGLKIGVMGCCVNGPGEMADADYGYVGAGRGKITLYRKQKIIKAGIPETEAVDALIDLIRLNGDWK
jgi:(E)-4-hydroxy-3-methylbut-2-enyl-diphosphate synthase